ncbi:EH signature domain-containing protein [Sulfobacillus thermosulfidooxidans]|uniref:EH signature domain-containing protein n=1 Tax=Sulfobacillus thermosulfidooxidans TaxID=28034 RepID=UPI0006B4D839|nr:EH signature domain-containing protein [Sulfobacillus thermosulfidooxidans]
MTTANGFRYVPEKLQQKRQNLAKVYPHDQDNPRFLAALHKGRLPRLLEILEGMSDMQILQWADTMDRIDLYVLIVFYTTHVPASLHAKVQQLAKTRWDDLVLSLIWDMFVESPESAYIELMRLILHTVEQFPWWSKTPPAMVEAVRLAFLENEPLITWANSLRPGALEYDLQALGLSRQHTLAHVLVSHVLVAATPLIWQEILATKNFSWSSWSVQIDDKSRGRAQQVMRSYLLKVPVDQYDTTVIQSFLGKWGNPELPTEAWRKVGDDARERVRQWLRLQRLKQFFSQDNARFQFWKGYLDRCRHVEIWEELTAHSAVVLYFDKIVAVEYSYVGNACYLYLPQDIDIVRRHAHNSLHLKDQEKAQRRLLHSGAWQENFKWELESYLGFPHR